MKLISGAECVRRLRQAGVFKGKESYFSQLVQKGIIPYHNKAASPKKWYILDEVKQALKEWEDPTRDAQREANEKKRNKLNAKDDQMEKFELQVEKRLQWFNSMPELQIKDFNLEDLEDMTQEEFMQELQEINSDNNLIKEMANDFVQEARKRSDEKIDFIMQSITVLDFLNKWTMLHDSIEEFYCVVKK